MVNFPTTAGIDETIKRINLASAEKELFGRTVSCKHPQNTS